MVSKQIVADARRQSVTEIGSGSPDTWQELHERTAPWLQLANLLPSLPSPDQLNQAHNGPAAMLRLSESEARSRSLRPADFVKRFADSSLANSHAFRGSIDLKLLRIFPERARRFLALAGEVAVTLDSLCRASDPEVLSAAGASPLMVRQLYVTPSTSWSEIWMREGVVATRYIDPFKDFVAALDGMPAGRIRVCPVCSRFFFASRKDQKACSRRCNAVRRVRDWRAKQGQHEYRRKLRTAGLLPRGRKRRNDYSTVTAVPGSLEPDRGIRERGRS